jgi:hypothetical protein
MKTVESLSGLEALENQIRAVKPQLHYWRGIACGQTSRSERRSHYSATLLLAALFVYALTPARPSQAARFVCSSGDVACLITAINMANANGEANTITLRAGTYTLTAVDNITEGLPDERNGLPSITSTLILRGAGPGSTILQRAATVTFRLLHIAASGTLTLEGLTLQGGRCLACLGGGAVRNLGTLTLRHSVVRRNNSDEFNGGPGGGLQNLGTATLTHCAVTDNINANSSGGGVDNEGTMTIHRCTFTNNSALEGQGGGIQNRGTLLLTASALNDNVSHAGGGILNRGVLMMMNSTVTGRQWDGLFNSGTATVLNSTIAGNVRGVTNGGTGTVVLLNALLAGNFFSGNNDDCGGSLTSLGHNLIGDPTGCTITLQPSDLTGDPGLDAFTDDGTPGNGHFPLLSISQAIDEADNATCFRTDQLGKQRVGPCDIGAISFRNKDDRGREEQDDDQ